MLDALSAAGSTVFTTLAQSGAGSSALAQWLNPPAPAPLPEPSWVQVWILEKPWYGAAALVLAGIIGALMLRSRGMAKPAVATFAAMLGLACAVLAAGLTVRTPREMLTRATRDLVRAVAEANTGRLDQMLDPSCKLVYFLAPEGLGNAGIVERVRTQFSPGATYALSRHEVEIVQAAATGPGRGATQARVLVVPAGAVYNAPMRSWWRIDWVRDPSTGALKATGITPVSLPGVP